MPKKRKALKKSKKPKKATAPEKRGHAPQYRAQYIAGSGF